VTRPVWPHLWLWPVVLALSIGGILWSQTSAELPLAMPPPEGSLEETPAVTMATRYYLPMLSSTCTLTPVPTPTATPEAKRLRARPPLQFVGPSPTVPVGDHGPHARELLPPPIPAAVCLGADERGRYILIDQATQTMHVFEGGREIKTFPVSTGIPGSQTQTPEWSGVVGRYVGTFKSFGTYQDHGWYLFEQGGSILLHGAPYTLDESGRKVYLELDALGQRPSSHGCIRLAPEDAVWLTEWNPQGVAVTITAWPFDQPERESDYDRGKGVG